MTPTHRLDSQGPTELCGPTDRCAFDPRVLSEVLRGDRVKVERFARRFVETSRPIVDQIATARSSRDPSTIAAAAHKLKSSAGSVGAPSLATLTHDLEREALSADWPAIDDLVVRLVAAFGQVVWAIDQEFR
jgi:HPt (histidine-containing phosphotransfer) domain-containing protein